LDFAASLRGVIALNSKFRIQNPKFTRGGSDESFDWAPHSAH
jgi:hypothetical protein